MLKSKYKLFYLIFAIHLIIALGFYFQNLNANYSSLSSDIQNIIPVAQKFDNPDLFKKDLYVNDINNVKYYTPFFVQPLRFAASFKSGNYVQAVNLMNTICHLLFGILWFYLIYRFVPNFWIALLVSILVRGIVWLPGYEIWGITNLWAMMPRTLYITLLPVPFLVLGKQKKQLFWSAFLVGLIFNFHPITGLGGILLYLTFLVLLVYIFKFKNHVSIKNTVILLLALVVGMLPFIFTYFGKTSSTVNYDIDAYRAAFNTRIPEFFTDPWMYLRQWLYFKTLFFTVPVLLYFVLTRKIINHYKRLKLIVFLMVILVLMPTLSVFVEQFVNSVFGLNLRMSFQLIRAQKIAIVPSFFAMAYLLQYLNKKISKPLFMPLIFLGFLITLLVCKLPVFNTIPYMGDDITRTILPNNISFGASLSNSPKDEDVMANYIEENTHLDALIFGEHTYRGASKRSIVLDNKGASMLIEGNPKQLIKWKEDLERYSKAKTIEAKIEVLKSFGVNYIVSNVKYPLEIVHTEGNLKLYFLQ